MSVSWTEEQKQAIDAFGKGVTVSAAAGSGKTAVLIERIIRLLADREKNIPADRLLAVTFTNDAAAQMRDKLSAAFDKRLSESPDDTWLMQQRDLVQLARISTIDSFCLDLVKENLNSFDFQGGLKILGEAESELIFQKALELALEELYAQDREEYAFIDNFLDMESGEVYGVIKELTGHLASICRTDSWLKNALEACDSDDSFEMLKKYMMAKLAGQAQAMEAALDTARYYYNYTCTGDDGVTYAFSSLVATSGNNMGLCADTAMAVRLAIDHADRSELMKVEKPAFARMLLKKGLPADVSLKMRDVKEAFAKTIRAVAEKAEEIKVSAGLSDEHLRDNLRLSNKVFSAVYRLYERTEKISHQMKLEKNAVDFSDVELMAKQLLVNETEEGFERTPLCEEIRKSGMYQLILIDEYQDVNDIQEMIFKSVSDTDDLSIMGRDTFIVGDMKQAIYGFRKTNPQLFKDSISKACDEKNQGLLEHIRLRKNFRSRKEVLDISNFIFSLLMSDDCGEVDYNEDERLQQGASYTQRECPAEVVLVNEPEERGELPEELRAAAARIRQMLDTQAPVDRGGFDEPCKQSDFCILVNTNEDIKLAAQALREQGLTAFSEDTAGYIRSREISLALDMLRCVDDPMNDIALAGVMMSPIMGFDADEMAAVREKCRVGTTRRFNHIFQVLSEAAREEGDDPRYAKKLKLESEAVREKCRSAHKLIRELRYCSMSMSLEGLIRHIYEVTDLMSMTSVYLDGAKKRANLRLLVQYAADYERSGNEGVTGFLRFIDSVSGNDKAFKNAVSVAAGADSVSIKTYHRSKGLEYPFVVLCTLSDKLVKDNRSSLLLHKSKGYALTLNDRRLNVNRRNLYYEYLSDILDNEQRSERMRLFYVGCTRAKEKLIMILSAEKSGRVKADTKMQRIREAVAMSAKYDVIPGKLLHAQESLLAWTVLALARHSKRDQLEDWLGMSLDSVPMVPHSDQVALVISTYEGYSPKGETAVQDSSAAVSHDPSAAVKLRKRLENTYDSQRTRQAAKLTVTEIVSKEKEKLYKDKDPEFYPNLPRLSEELDKLTAAQRGTFTHKFMELADYENAKADVRAELKRLTDKGFFTPKEAGGVYVDRLEEFVKSSFFERMLSSQDLRREQRFLARTDDLGLTEELKEYTGGEGFVQGIADCIFKEDDGWVLVDYKTDNFKTVDEMSKYSMQLKLYKAAFELLIGEKVKSSYIYSFKLGVGMEFDL